MSLKKSATRRLSLLAGSSLVAASLTAFGGVALAPTTAAAQAVCAPPPTTGAGTDTVTYAPGTYDPGITCTASGGAMTVSTTGAITVSTTAGTVGAPLTNGVNLSGGTQNVTWNSTAGTVTGGAQTNGPIIEAITTTGAINISTAAVNRRTTPAAEVGNTITSGIRAESTTGAITISSSGVNIGTSPVGTSAVEAVSTSGAINITTTGTMTGRLRGILAQTGGAGSVTLNVGGFVSANGTLGEAGIDTLVGTGATVINITNGTISGGAGPAIRSVSASTSGVNVQNTGGTVNGRVDFSGVTAGGVTFNNTGTGSGSTTGRWTASGASTFTAFNDTIIMGGAGESSLAADGAINLGAGHDTWTLTSTNGMAFGAGSSVSFGEGNDSWSMSGAGRVRLAANTGVSFGGGNDTLTVASSLQMGGFTQDAGVIDFGDGTDTFNLSGVLTSHGGTLVNLEAFNHSGTIFMGIGEAGTTSNPAVDWTKTDLAADDILRLPGVAFTGSGSGRVVMDVSLDPGFSQLGCQTVTGAADCLDLTGGSTAGLTLLMLNYIGPDANQGAFIADGVTLVDVGGGTSAAEHFVLDPNSTGYMVDPLFGGIIARPGLFNYALRYDAQNQRHVLASVPHAPILEYAMLSGAAQSIWHLTAETVTDRQTDLRERAAGGAVWLRAAGEYTKRDSASGFESFGETFAVDTGHKLYAGTIMGGMDLITGHSGGYDYIAGFHIGYVASSFDLNASETSGRFSGATGGVYGGIWTERFFLDGTFNMNGLTLDYDAPGLGSKTNTYTTAFGARLDGGMRLPLTGVLFAEPLVSLAFARTGFEEISLSGGEIRPADAQSRRAALGMRLGGDVDGQIVNWSYYLTGRAWNEFDGEAAGVVNNPGVDLPFVDEFSGGFGEAEAGLSLYNDANTLSGFVASGVKFKDGYSAIDLSLGIRMRW